MMFVLLGLLFALFVPTAGYADSESDVLLKTVAFALTANDETRVEPLDQGNCVFRINNDIYRLNNVRLDRLGFQDQVRKLKNREHRVTLVLLSSDATVQESIYEGLDENNNELTAEMMRELKENFPGVFKAHNTTFKQVTLVLPTDDGGRVRDAWRFIYSHGCSGTTKAESSAGDGAAAAFGDAIKLQDRFVAPPNTSKRLPFTVASDNTAQTAGRPTISYLSPISGSVGAQITIHGSSFGATNNMVIFQASDGGIRYVGGRPEHGGQSGIPSPDGTSITFTVPSTVQSACPGPAHCGPHDEAVVAGSYTVQVVRLDTDRNVPSNIVPFTVP
jgi:hypothetical protein